MIISLTTVLGIMCLSNISFDVGCGHQLAYQLNLTRGTRHLEKVPWKYLRRCKRQAFSWQKTLEIIKGGGEAGRTLNSSSGITFGNSNNNNNNNKFWPTASNFPPQRLPVAQEEQQQYQVVQSAYNIPQTQSGSYGFNRFNGNTNRPQYGQFQPYRFGGNPINYIPDSVGSSLQCFTSYYDSLVINLQPFERRYGITVNDCAYHCLTSARLIRVNCRSFGFNFYSSTCDLFIGTGIQPPSMLVNIPGNSHYIVNAECEQQPVEPSASTSFLPTTTFAIATTNVPPKSCPSGKSPVMQKISRKQLANPNGPQFAGSDEAACYQGCQNNLAPDGSPFMCTAANFVRSTGNCQFLLTVAAPVGTGTLESNSNADYFEKICVTDPLGQNCRGPLDRHSQSVLVGFNQMVINTSYVGCMEMCLQSQTLFSFVCKSANYYYTLPSDNCVLNFDDSSQSPQLLVEQNDDKTEYFEVTKCISPTRSLDKNPRTFGGFG